MNLSSRTEDRTQNHLGTCSICERDIITIRPYDFKEKFSNIRYFMLYESQDVPRCYPARNN